MCSPFRALVVALAQRGARWHPTASFTWTANDGKIATMRFASAALLLMTAACQAQPTREVTLPSGKKVNVIAVGQINFANDGPALMLKYQTDLKISDLPALRKEVDEIWSVFKGDVEKANLTNAIISANEKPQGLIIKNAKGFNFVFKKVDGAWRLMDDSRKP